jgi:hypothetical protein
MLDEDTPHKYCTHISYAIEIFVPNIRKISDTRRDGKCDIREDLKSKDPWIAGLHEDFSFHLSVLDTTHVLHVGTCIIHA